MNKLKYTDMNNMKDNNAYKSNYRKCINVLTKFVIMVILIIVLHHCTCQVF